MASAEIYESMIVSVSGTRPIEVITAQLKEEAPKLEEIAPAVDRHVGHLVRKMMRTDPERRYQTYADVVSDIDLCLMSRESDDDLTVCATSLTLATGPRYRLGPQLAPCV